MIVGEFLYLSDLEILLNFSHFLNSNQEIAKNEIQKCLF